MVDKALFDYQYIGHPTVGHQGYFVDFLCGHCGNKGNGAVIAEYTKHSPGIRWVMCPTCSHGTVIDRNGITYPSPKFGDELQGLPKEVSNAYDEARNCMSVNAFSACTLLCRKLLMHVAVDKGDTEGKNFTEYIDYLKTSGYITSAMDDWVDKIREGGNDATHKIPPATEKIAKNILLFIIQLLRNVYEMKFIADQQMGQNTKDYDVEEILKDSK